ncbi:hypothetical protein HMPREF1140_1032 [Lachnoanaerobaculum sp. ICM7]|nr:hypothetical protein HMPREF1140_1032 [Lachnoanaerobaculum sp. ICM7]
MDKLYDAYMYNDSLNLLHEEFDYMIDYTGYFSAYFLSACLSSIKKNIFMKKVYFMV